MTPNIAAIMRQHVSLEVRCLDRVYLHAYMPKLQTSGGLCYFLQEHLGYPIPPRRCSGLSTSAWRWCTNPEAAGVRLAFACSPGEERRRGPH